jgi:rhamnogalacturonan hydrolase
MAVLPLKAMTMVLPLLLHGRPASLEVKVSSHIKVLTGLYLPWEVYIPSGNYEIATWVTLTSGTAISIRLDGIIYRTA